MTITCELRPRNGFLEGYSLEMLLPAPQSGQGHWLDGKPVVIFRLHDLVEPPNLVKILAEVNEQSGAAPEGGIPEEFHDDPVLSELQDPITLAPILNPVFDRRHPQHIYERAEILKVIAVKAISPLTREPLTEEDLIPCPELKEKINRRLKLLMEQRKPLEKENAAELAAKKYEEETKLFRNLPIENRIAGLAQSIVPSVNESLAFPSASNSRSLAGRCKVLNSATDEDHLLLARSEEVKSLVLTELKIIGEKK